jgi:hypothetical protein
MPVLKLNDMEIIEGLMRKLEGFIRDIPDGILEKLRTECGDG